MCKYSKEMIEEAAKEKKISESDLASEIKTLISKEFVCKIKQHEDILVLKFFNGQVFTISISDYGQEMRELESIIKEIDDSV